jgi:hypothetical protein
MSDEGGKGDKGDHDVVFLQGPTDDGEGTRALRSRPGKLELAELRPVKEDRPLARTSELVGLRPTRLPYMYEVETLMKKPEPAEEKPTAETGHGGPPRVSSDTYRKNFDRIFGKKILDVS